MKISSNRIISPIGEAIDLALCQIAQPFDGRKNVISTHWDFYLKSGILDYLAKQIRDRFKIPRLDPEDDIITGWVATNESRDIEVTRFMWFEGNKYREEISKAVNDIVKILYLPKNAFDFVLYYTLYRKEPSGYPFYDTNIVYEMIWDENSEPDFTGYTAKEVRYLKELCAFTVASGLFSELRKLEKRDVEKRIVQVNSRIDALIAKNYRKIRPLRNLRKDTLIVKWLKSYKKSRKTYDVKEQIDAEQKMTSELIATEIYKSLEDDAVINSASFRKQFERLKKKFPFLSETYPNVT